MTFVKCPSCGKTVVLTEADGECSNCGARLEADSASPVMRKQSEVVLAGGKLKGRWLVLVLAVAIAVTILAGVVVAVLR
jgi:DNA-directed RNA polymerase subunit RPC12/RpoP